jgi:hypothetical protein
MESEVNRSDEYRRLAADALRLAEDAKNERDRIAWQRLAKHWLNLEARGDTDATDFDAAIRARGTDRETSSTSHQ